jgi:hypothetical protein
MVAVGGKEGAMANGDIHTVPHERGWANRIEGGARVSSVHSTRTEAERRGREMAFRRKVEHLIYNQRGSVTKRNSYGNGLPVANGGSAGDRRVSERGKHHR